MSVEVRDFALVSGGSEVLPDQNSTEQGHLFTAAAGQIGPLNTGPIVFNNGVPVGGWAQLTIFSNGATNFSGHFHDSGGTSYDVSLVIVVKSRTGTAYTFTDQGRVHGTFEPGSRDHNWGESPANAALAQDFGNINSWWWSAAANLDVTGLVDGAIKALGGAATVIGIVSDRNLKRDVVDVEWSR